MGKSPEQTGQRFTLRSMVDRMRPSYDINQVESATTKVIDTLLEHPKFTDLLSNGSAIIIEFKKTLESFVKTKSPNKTEIYYAHWAAGGLIDLIQRLKIESELSQELSILQALRRRTKTS